MVKLGQSDVRRSQQERRQRHPLPSNNLDGHSSSKKTENTENDGKSYAEK